jgi:chitinase
LFQPYKGIPNGSWGGGAYEYKDLAANYISKFNRYWDAEALVPWLFDPKTGIMISYDDPQSLKAKADYVMKNDLGGMMIWELSNDAADHTLLRAVHDALQ